jgi:hypothetical protein
MSGVRRASRLSMNREQWLTVAVEHLENLFDKPVPDVHVSCGWPSRGGTSTKKRVIGECWKPETSEDGKSHIYVSPTLTEPVAVLSTLLHEMIHAMHPEAKHRGDFAKTAKAVGFLAPWTQTPESDELKAALQVIAEDIGEPYPHSKVTPSVQRKVQSTRMLKVQCPECGYTARTTQKWLEVGLPTCPCGTQMEQEVK